ncbi:S-layer homology domain-containing protein [uncultured Veillonella sp.]|uniref:S-layer homology domain-containing protein n=1 Tax=uncultured Veillonella sp. TaxID=159268 RepID=UPI00258C615B|nr:S-layer homology domain-containing protein [uncultured Veillonella sp.]
MKKRFAAVFAATAVLGVTTAFAANPFSDVTPSDWAYQSVSQLAAAGVINGYPDGTFQGQKNITRYEMAQMVAKAMANEARANAEQQAMINRLADEFSSELNNLGVRVANLENKVGNVKVTGDVRLRYQGSDKKEMFATKKDENKKSQFDFRGRVQFNATVNENTSAVVRLTSGNQEFGNAKAGKDAEIDNVYVTHNFGKDFSLTAGRFDTAIGNGLIYDDVFDGAALTYAGDKVTATVAHGYFMEGTIFDGPRDAGVKLYGENGFDADDNMSFTVLQAKGQLGTHATLGGFYAFGNKNVKNRLGDDQDIYGGSLDLNFNKVWIGGEYATFSDDFQGEDGSDKDAWVAGIGYGDYNIAKEGTWGVKVQYFDEGAKSPVISSTWNQPYTADYKAWMATVDYALAKNVGLSAYATFGAEDQDGNDAPEYYRAQLNYKF